jgi:transposase
VKLTTGSSQEGGQMEDTLKPTRSNPKKSACYAKVVELFGRGLSYSQIGKQLGLHSRTVQKWLRNAGKVQANPRSCERYAHIPVAKVIELHDLGMNNREIGKKLGMGPSTVGKWLRKAGKATPKAVTAEQLKEARLDPAWEARRGIRNRVVCRMCGEPRPSLNDPKRNHLHKHHMTAGEYARKYPGARLMSFDLSASHLRWFGQSKTADELMAEFAARYLTPLELQEYLKDPKWEEHHGIKDFVACRLCGFKCEWRLADHLMRVHGINSAAYRLQFPKSLLLPLSKVDSERDRSREKGRALRASAEKSERMAEKVTTLEPKAAIGNILEDLKNKPVEWRQIGPWLLMYPKSL